MWSTWGPQNMNNTALRKQASGCKPRRAAHNQVNTPARNTCSAMVMLIARAKGKTTKSAFRGYNSPDCKPKNGAPQKMCAFHKGRFPLRSCRKPNCRQCEY